MLSAYINLIGLAAAVLTTSAFLPQIVRTWRLGGYGLSYFMLALYLLGVTLWLIYGIALNAMPIIVANGAAAVQVLAILALKVRKSSARVR